MITISYAKTNDPKLYTFEELEVGDTVVIQVPNSTHTVGLYLVINQSGMSFDRTAAKPMLVVLSAEKHYIHTTTKLHTDRCFRKVNLTIFVEFAK